MGSGVGYPWTFADKASAISRSLGNASLMADYCRERTRRAKGRWRSERLLLGLTVPFASSRGAALLVDPVTPNRIYDDCFRRSSSLSELATPSMAPGWVNRCP